MLLAWSTLHCILHCDRIRDEEKYQISGFPRLDSQNSDVKHFSFLFKRLILLHLILPHNSMPINSTHNSTTHIHFESIPRPLVTFMLNRLYWWYASCNNVSLFTCMPLLFSLTVIIHYNYMFTFPIISLPNSSTFLEKKGSYPILFNTAEWQRSILCWYNAGKNNLYNKEVSWEIWFRRDSYCLVQ